MEMHIFKYSNDFIIISWPKTASLALKSLSDRQREIFFSGSLHVYAFTFARQLMG